MQQNGCGPRPPDGAIAVIFVSQRNDADEEGYAAAAQAMARLASGQPGYLGHVGTRGADGLGITISYWATQDDARAWRDQADHALVRALGRSRWYDGWQLIVTQVARTEQGPGPENVRKA